MRASQRASQRELLPVKLPGQLTQTNTVLTECGMPESGDLSNFTTTQLRAIINKLAQRVENHRDLVTAARHIGGAMVEGLQDDSFTLSDTRYLRWADHVASSISRLIAEGKADKQSVVTALHKRIKELEAYLSAAQLETSEATEESRRLANALKDAKRSTDQAKEGHARALTANKQLRAQIQSLESDYKNQITKLEAKITTLQTEHTQQLKNLVDQTQALRKEYELLSDTYKQSNANQSEELRTLTRSITDKIKGETGALQSKTVSQADQIKALNNNIARLNRELSNHQKALARKNEKIADLEQRLKAKQEAPKILARRPQPQAEPAGDAAPASSTAPVAVQNSASNIQAMPYQRPQAMLMSQMPGIAYTQPAPPIVYCMPTTAGQIYPYPTQGMYLPYPTQGVVQAPFYAAQMAMPQTTQTAGMYPPAQ
ncbi:MAG: hypothetical protein K0R66_856 [Gammaproteobacteria bacterium]|jgi:myosin heavy subunit|nr:hypothetical protein [Gammaproteobacteria bacterium]